MKPESMAATVTGTQHELPQADSSHLAQAHPDQSAANDLGQLPSNTQSTATGQNGGSLPQPQQQEMMNSALQGQHSSQAAWAAFHQPVVETSHPAIIAPH